MKTVRVDYSEFARSHGKNPRGRGQWAFFFGRSTDVGQAFFFYGGFAEACKAAKGEATTRGFSSVRVGA